MKIKGISFGRGGTNDRIDIPGIGNVLIRYEGAEARADGRYNLIVSVRKW